MGDYGKEHSIIKIIEQLLHNAIVQGASDIHGEPQAHQLRLRFRIDGVLYDQSPLDELFIHNFISRIKILAHLNIAEKRIPQDGRFTFSVDNHAIDIRVSTFPSVFGEKIVLRLLNRSAQMIDLNYLGFEESMLEHFKSLLKRSSGFFLVTGPTGSGKTTTLYAALRDLNSVEKHIITLEDPVEYTVEGLTQGHIHPDAGFTFEKGIRALLRQDPDIVMIGEIRDKQTAQIAIEAALTGHLVLSTLHTNDAVSALVRLIDMGIEPFLLNAALSGVLAQRLVRRLCQQCRYPIALNDAEYNQAERLKIGAQKLFKSLGCVDCSGRGMKGRMGIFELLEPSDRLKQLVIDRVPHHELVNQARKDGLQTLMVDGISKAEQGLVNLGELVRVLF